jgi:hypothetical protein
MHDIHEQFMQQWRKESGGMLNHDGAITAAYYTSEPRICFILKETHATANGIDIRTSILDALSNPRSGWRTKSKVLPRIGRWAYGMLNEEQNFQQAKKNQFSDDVLKKIAWINILKTSGKRSTPQKKLESFVSQQRINIIRQLDILSPDILVCCGVYSVMKRHIFRDIIKLSSHLYFSDGRYIIDSFHPAYYGVTADTIYSRVMSANELIRRINAMKYDQGEFKCFCGELLDGRSENLNQLIVMATSIDYKHAQWFLGWLYENGEIVNQSSENAAFWFKKALRKH